MTRLPIQTMISGAIALAASALLVTGCKKSTANNQTNGDVDRLYTVQKNDLVISTLLNGTVNARDKHKLALEAPFPTTLNWVVEESSQAKAGDVIIKLETEDLLLKISDLEAKIGQTKNTLFNEQKNKAQNQAANALNIKKAKDSVVTAEEALEKYLKYEEKT